MKPILFAGLAVLSLVVGCSAAPTSSPDEKSQITQSTSPTDPSGSEEFAPPSGSFGSALPLGKQCSYKGGCDGNDIHPTSGTLIVDGKDCGIAGAAATMHMSPDGMMGLNPGWFLESDGGTCGAFSVAGSHTDAFPQTGTTAWGNKDRVDLGGTAASAATLTSGPIDYEPKAIQGTATVDGHEVKFTIYFGDED